MWMGTHKNTARKGGSDLRLPSSRYPPSLHFWRSDRTPPPHPRSPLWHWHHDQQQLAKCEQCTHTRPSWKGRRSCGFFCLLGHLLGHCPRHQTADNVSNDDPPHSSIRFVQCRQSPQPDAIDHLLRNISTSQLGNHFDRIWLALQDRKLVVSCHS